MPPNRFESEVESFLEGSHGDRTHIKRADHPRLHHYAGHYFALRLCFSAKARKSSPRMPKTAEKRCFQARWANFFAEMPLERPRWANFFAGKLLEAPRRANFVAHAGAPAHVRSLRCPPCLQWWGFCTTRVASRIVV